MTLESRLRLVKQAASLTPQQQNDLLMMLIGAMGERIAGTETIEELITRVEQAAVPTKEAA